MKFSVESVIIISVACCGIITMSPNKEAGTIAIQTMQNILMAYAGYMTKSTSKED